MAATGRHTPIDVRDGFRAVENADYTAGIRHLRDVLAADVHTPRIYGLLGGALLALKRSSAADSVFSEGLKRFPGEGELFYLIGLIYISEGYRIDDAQQYLQEALAMNLSDDKAEQIRRILAQLSSMNASPR